MSKMTNAEIIGEAGERVVKVYLEKRSLLMEEKHGLFLDIRHSSEEDKYAKDDFMVTIMDKYGNESKKSYIQVKTSLRDSPSFYITIKESQIVSYAKKQSIDKIPFYIYIVNLVDGKLYIILLNDFIKNGDITHAGEESIEVRKMYANNFPVTIDILEEDYYIKEYDSIFEHNDIRETYEELYRKHMRKATIIQDAFGY